ncbi:MAG TPA: hypothetical protein ENN78_00830 [Candidatus Omnitrophica bacterium]|nr:hypothetical protein [Candidatus Omnitrophota bacterium]
MKTINWASLKNAKIFAGSIFAVLFLSVLLGRPKNVDEIFKSSYIKRIREYSFNVPEQEPLDSYIETFKKQNIFYFADQSKGPAQVTDEKDALDNFSFNGIIVLDKKYLAVYDKSDGTQHMLPEGGSRSGLKVKEILEQSAIIEIEDEEKEIRF